MTRQYSLPPDADSIGEARRHVRDLFGSHTDADTLSRAELVVSELVTNSVRHGPGQPITLRLTADANGRVGGELEDQGSGVVSMQEQEIGAVGGLGLVIVDQLSSAWGVRPESTHVWFRVDP